MRLLNKSKISRRDTDWKYRQTKIMPAQLAILTCVGNVVDVDSKAVTGELEQRIGSRRHLLHGCWGRPSRRVYVGKRIRSKKREQAREGEGRG